MAKKVSLTRYPLLKVLVPLALVVLAIGLYMFFANPAADGSLDPKPLLLYIVVAAVVAFAGLLWKRKEELTVLLPTDRLQDASRQDLQGILDTLDRQREKGELTPERYTKARNRVLKEMESAAKPKGAK